MASARFLRTNREGKYGLHLQGDFDQSCTRPGLVCGPGYRRPAHSVSACLVTDTRLEPDARIVTFGNGMVLREPIIAINEDIRRFVWSAEGGPFTHYNASLQVFAENEA